MNFIEYVEVNMDIHDQTIGYWSEIRLDHAHIFLNP
jgi:hypothetical protein